MKIDLKNDEIFLRLNIERCRELYDTGILLDGGKNPFVQSVLIELMIRLRHLEHIFNSGLVNDSIVNIRDAGAHPYLNREIKGSNIIVDFGRIFKGNWKLNDRTFEMQNGNCDVEFQYGDSKISVKEILELIKRFESEIKKL